jgi:hypothetical protein
MGMDDRELKYEVYVDDNFHYMDESERYSAGLFDSWEAAEAKCRLIVDDFLRANYKEGMLADQLLSQYRLYGEDPWIRPSGDDRTFSAWDYAAARCEEMCRVK